MKKGATCGALLVALMLNFSMCLGQDVPGPRPKKPRTLDDYHPRTLKELNAVKSGADLGDKQERLIVHSDILPSRITVTYTGFTRPLPEIKKEVIRQWARLYAGNPDHYTKPYETEIFFEEAGVGQWIAIPQRSLTLFRQKHRQGERVDLYLIRLGKARNDIAWEPVLLVEQFVKPPDQNVVTPLKGDGPGSLTRVLKLLKTRLSSNTAQNLSVQIREGCRLQITEKTRKSKALTRSEVYIPLSDIDPASVIVFQHRKAALWELKLRTVGGRRSILFMLYQQGPAEGGQKAEETILFKSRNNAIRAAEAFRSASRICLYQNT